MVLDGFTKLRLIFIHTFSGETLHDPYFEATY